MASGWASLGLDPSVIGALEAREYFQPAEVQCKLIPPFLRGENLIGQAKSGSGKTVAYAAGVIQDVDLAFENPAEEFLLLPTTNSKDPQIAVAQRLQSLIVIPTREIGIQVASELARLAVHLKPALTGGTTLSCDGSCCGELKEAELAAGKGHQTARDARMEGEDAAEIEALSILSEGMAVEGENEGQAEAAPQAGLIEAPAQAEIHQAEDAGLQTLAEFQDCPAQGGTAPGGSAPAVSAPEGLTDPPAEKKYMACICRDRRIDSSVSILACVGGCPVTYDLLAMRLRRPQIVVVTPGRFLTLVQDDSSQTLKKAKTVHSSVAHQIKTLRWRVCPLKNLIFDEADRLFCESFRAQVISMANLISALGRTRVCCYSATFPPPILSFAEKLIYDLTTDRETERGDIGLHVIVDGVDPEPEWPSDRILRKCFMVSSFYDQTLKSARIPLRMDADQNVPTQTLATPVLQNVQCLVLSVPEVVAGAPAAVQGVVEDWVACLELRGRLNLSDGCVHDPALMALRVLGWMDEDFDHWPDLRMKSLALFLCVWRAADFEKLVVFCNDLFSGLKIAQFLNHIGIRSEYISAKIDHAVRQKRLSQFRSTHLRALVTSDLSARGLDIPEVDLIINLDLPESHDTCLHRIGRCSRFHRHPGTVYFIVRKSDELPTLQLFATQTQLPLLSLNAEVGSAAGRSGGAGRLERVAGSEE